MFISNKQISVQNLCSYNCNFAENELDVGADMVVKLEEALGVEVLLDWEMFQARPCLLLLL